jgi:hypothetical protein
MGSQCGLSLELTPLQGVATLLTQAPSPPTSMGWCIIRVTENSSTSTPCQEWLQTLMG